MFSSLSALSHKEAHHLVLLWAVWQQIFLSASTPSLKSHQTVWFVLFVLLRQVKLGLCPFVSSEVLFPLLKKLHISQEELKQPKESLCAPNLDILKATSFYLELKPVTVQFQDTLFNSGPPCYLTSWCYLADNEAPVSFSISGKV